MNSERHPRVLLMLSQPPVYYSAEKILRHHGCSLLEKLDDITRCDLIMFDAFFAHAGLKELSPDELWNKPAVLVAAPDEIGDCGPCDDVILIRSNKASALEKTFEQWIEDTLHVLAICPSKISAKGILSKLLMADLRLSA